MSARNAVPVRRLDVLAESLTGMCLIEASAGTGKMRPGCTSVISTTSSTNSPSGFPRACMNNTRAVGGTLLAEAPNSSLRRIRGSFRPR